MNARLVGMLALIALVFTLLWVLFMVLGMGSGATDDRLVEHLDQVQERDVLYTATYANALLVTVSVTMLFGALYAHYAPTAPAWAAVGIVFVPVYSALNLLVYASQITIVPQLLEFMPPPGSEGAASYFLAQMIQIWPGSAMGTVNGLAYAILGIPSIIYGLLLWRGNGLLRAAGVLLVVNAIACIAGPIGVVTGIPALEVGTVLGGFLFLSALVPLSFAFLRMESAG